MEKFRWLFESYHIPMIATPIKKVIYTSLPKLCDEENLNLSTVKKQIYKDGLYMSMEGVTHIKIEKVPYIKNTRK